MVYLCRGSVKVGLGSVIPGYDRADNDLVYDREYDLKYDRGSGDWENDLGLNNCVISPPFLTGFYVSGF